jgi:hypothetical protein
MTRLLFRPRAIGRDLGLRQLRRRGKAEPDQSGISGEAQEATGPHEQSKALYAKLASSRGASLSALSQAGLASVEAQARFPDA